MAASKTRDIRDALIGVISPLQLDGEDAFTAVVGHAGFQGENFPQVQVLPGTIGNEKAASYQTDRTVAFIVRTLVDQQDNGADFDQMYPLTDLIIDALDAADNSNTFLNSLDTYLLNANRGDWEYVDTQSGTALMADINVEVTYSHNV